MVGIQSEVTYMCLLAETLVQNIKLSLFAGGLVLSGGLLGLVFSRNALTFGTVMLGGALLALSTFSLKIWRQGKSSLPFILGQAGKCL